MSETSEVSSPVAAEAAVVGADVGTPWRRLDPRMLVVAPAIGIVRLLPVIAVALFGTQNNTMQLWIPLGLTGLVVLGGIVRWRTTRYRVTPDRVELHSGWLRRQRRSVPRDRIRTVDLTAKLAHRLFGLNVVEVRVASAAVSEHQRLILDAVGKAEAERLRRELLDRSPAVAAPVPAAPAPAAPVQELARLDWSWLRFAPLTFSSIAGIGAVGAGVFNLLGEFGVDPRDIGAVDDAADRIATAPLWVGVLIIGLALLAVAVVGALLLFAERWYGYRLTREPAGDDSSGEGGSGEGGPGDGTGTLHVRRGLLTRRSLSVAEQRVRGAEVVEPLPLRAGRGAQARVLATGLARDAQGGALQPPVPRPEAHRVAAQVLHDDPAATTLVPLYRHPRAALVRRVSRALGPAAALVVAAFVTGAAVPSLTWLGPTSLVLLPVAVLLAADRYRNLGHRLTARHLVTRSGSLQRRTVVLQRAGVIGWTLRQSVFQQRAGVVTVEAVTAAGTGGYQVLDVAAADGVALADAAVPGLLTPFLAEPGPDGG